MNARLCASLLVALVAATACSDRSAPPPVVGPAPDTFHVALATSKGNVVVAVYKSWSPHGADGHNRGGRIYMTSLALLTLEVYYRHLPLYDKSATEAALAEATTKPEKTKPDNTKPESKKPEPKKSAKPAGFDPLGEEAPPPKK